MTINMTEREFLSMRAAFLLSVLLLGETREFETIIGYRTDEVLKVLEKMDFLYNSDFSGDISIHLSEDESSAIYHTLLTHIHGTGEYNEFKNIVDHDGFEFKHFFDSNLRFQLNKSLVR
ncbi:MAG: hypothetical protein LKH33_05840 [Acetobacter sp.]|nr:hypothetical protein [Acetobacter sp.]MCH4061900.1 hypothetical protein [Acetobacter sp.]MCH4089251.1 hypothetical protein [Acetobacter sp.]MCI1293577.1 hypothetical protein [Acetobacter sp.]MCI1320342.1 hypothetical protein [Acetobacter sp.]